MTEKTAPAGEARDLRALLAVVLDALALDYGADDYDQRLKDRAGLAKVVLQDGLGANDRLAWNADWLRAKLADEETAAAERAKSKCARCRQPFDRADLRHDGRGQYASTQWCRRCVDRCRESSDTFHQCPVCRDLGGGNR